MRHAFLLFTLLLANGGRGAAQGLPPVGETTDGGYSLPTAQLLHPAGKSVAFGGRPVDLLRSYDGATLYAKDNTSLISVDAATWQMKQRIAFPGGQGASLHGLAILRDGSKVYATTAQGSVEEALIGANGAITWGRKIAMPGGGFPCGLALAPDEKTAYVCLSTRNTLGVLNLATGTVTAEIAVGIAPWAVVISADGKTAYVSDWGGHRAKTGEKTAPSAGTPTPIDARGIASSGCVSLVNLTTAKETAEIETGLHPSAMALTADGTTLYVANSNSDTVSRIALASSKVASTMLTRPAANLPYGSAPTGLALSADEKTLYVTNGGNNGVAVLALGDAKTAPQVLGLIETGWYPGAIVADGQALYVANVKGIGSRATGQNGKYGVYNYAGTLSKIPLPTGAELAAYTAQALADAQMPAILKARLRAKSAGAAPVPVPVTSGQPSVIQHVVYILKENRTYDQLFGDIKQGNGDPTLCTFGIGVTPNHHALASQFALLDNYYCNGVLSADGHSWATEGNDTDHLEKAFGGFTRSYTFGDDPVTYSSSGFLWDNALANGKTFRNYGEMDYAGSSPNSAWTAIYNDYFNGPKAIKFTHNIGIANLRPYSNPDYPGWNLSIPDVVRADIFLKELATFNAANSFPNLTLIYLPNDHTGGDISAKGYLADNDLALGRIVEGISKSRFWASTCIFVNEDDPQAGYDHVDGHRSLCLVVSPYTKRGAVVHDFYNQTSVIHTIEQMLGLPAMNQMDAAAPLMSACFTGTPDPTPFTALPNAVPLADIGHGLNALKRQSAFWRNLSRKVRFDRPDASDEDALNRIIWHETHGEKTPYPAEFAGAHGRGLKARGLTLQPRRACNEKR